MSTFVAETYVQNDILPVDSGDENAMVTDLAGSENNVISMDEDVSDTVFDAMVVEPKSEIDVQNELVSTGDTEPEFILPDEFDYKSAEYPESQYVEVVEIEKIIDNDVNPIKDEQSNQLNSESIESIQQNFEEYIYSVRNG